MWEERHIPSKQSKQTAVTVQCLTCFHYLRLHLQNVLNIQAASDNTEFSSSVSALPQSRLEHSCAPLPGIMGRLVWLLWNILSVLLHYVSCRREDWPGQEPGAISSISRAVRPCLCHLSPDTARFTWPRTQRLPVGRPGLDGTWNWEWGKPWQCA